MKLSCGGKTAVAVEGDIGDIGHARRLCSHRLPMPPTPGGFASCTRSGTETLPPPACSGRICVFPLLFFLSLAFLISLCLLQSSSVCQGISPSLRENGFFFSHRSVRNTLTSGLQCRCRVCYYTNYTNLFHILLRVQPAQIQLRLSVTIIHPFSETLPREHGMEKIPKGKFAKYGPEGALSCFPEGQAGTFGMCEVRSVDDSPSFPELQILLSKFPLCFWVSWILEI